VIQNLEIKRSKLRDGIVEHLLGMMRDGQLKPGEYLPNERELATALGIGRASLREAIHQLEVLGYLQARQGEGTLVLDPSSKDIAKPFGNLLLGRPHLAQELLEFRALLEPGVAALAATRATSEDIQALEAALEVQHQIVASQQSLRYADLEFHELIARAAGNDVTLQVLSALRQLMLNLRERVLSDNLQHLTLEHHSAIVNAIRKQKPDKARVAMETHLKEVVRFAK
jgi:GntR family transcriptional regulator, transcriptional repressor for pyruvate dehydrogenase complex